MNPLLSATVVNLQAAERRAFAERRRLYARRPGPRGRLRTAMRARRGAPIPIGHARAA